MSSPQDPLTLEAERARQIMLAHLGPRFNLYSLPALASELIQSIRGSEKFNASSNPYEYTDKLEEAYLQTIHFQK